MTWLGVFWRPSAVFLAALLLLTFPGTYCELLVSPASLQVNALAGSNVTLAVSFSGATDPAVTWFRRGLPVVTWTINSPAAPDIPEDKKAVLKVESDGSLTFINVPLSYTDNYRVQITKSGLGTASANFTLTVFGILQNVSLSADPLIVEGNDSFTLQYSNVEGVVQQHMWFFNDIKIKDDSHYLLKEESLVIRRPDRNDTGQYALLLMNPFSSLSADLNITVLYGPDEPIIEAHPPQPFYVTGDSLNLSCRAEGYPKPTAEWLFDTETLPSHEGILNLTNVQTSQGGVYTCMMLNERTKKQHRKSIVLRVYEKPLGVPVCSVQSVNNVDLQYHCQWSGGTPLAQLSFPALSDTSGGAESISLTVPAVEDLDGKPVTCMADHPLEQNTCNVTGSRPVAFLPAVRTSFDLTEGKIVVTIRCVSDAMPKAVVSWSNSSEAVARGTTFQISRNTTQLEIRDYNVSNFLLQNYICTCRNPLGSQTRTTQLLGPFISDFSLFFPHEDRTIVTLTWEVPPTSVVTGFDIQMKGPDLVTKNRSHNQTRASSNKFRTIQQLPGSARSTDVFALDPDSTYRFRVIPIARLTEGEPSDVLRIGPSEGLSGPAIAGIAAGIPCSLLFLCLLGGSIYYACIFCNKNRSRQARYPVSRAVEKTITTQTDKPHNLLTGGLKSPPDYNRLHQTPSERSAALPSFVPPPPVRVATTV